MNNQLSPETQSAATPPKVTVLMSVYNGERYLGPAIESILNQTYTDFEFLIINDGSSDRSREIILSYSQIDPRVRLVDNQTNLGLIKSLNRGLELSRGSLVARQDADDISYPTRLQQQVAFMTEHPEVALLGAQADSIDENGTIRQNLWPLPVTQLGIQWRLLIDFAFVHTSVMFRRDVVWERFRGYGEEFKTREDAELWSRVAAHYEVRNLPEALVIYRNHPGSICATRGVKHDTEWHQIIRANTLRFARCDDFPNDDWIGLHIGSFSKRPLGGRKSARELVDGFDAVCRRFLKVNPAAAGNREIPVAAAFQLAHIARYLATLSPLQSIRAYIRACRCDPKILNRTALPYVTLLLFGESLPRRARLFVRQVISYLRNLMTLRYETKFQTPVPHLQQTSSSCNNYGVNR